MYSLLFYRGLFSGLFVGWEMELLVVSMRDFTETKRNKILTDSSFLTPVLYEYIYIVIFTSC